MQKRFSHLIKQHRAPLVLLCVSLFLHFFRLGYPNQVVFDEVLVGHYAATYFPGLYHFDIHPPHTKLIYALLAYLGGMDPGFTFPAPDVPYPGSFYLVMRALPAFAGSMLPLLAYALSRELGVQRLWALTAGWLILLDSALLVDARFILNDMLMLTWGVAAWWSYAVWRRLSGWRWLLLAGACLAMALSVKWTGLGFVLPVLAVHIVDLWRQSTRQRWLGLGVLAMIPLLWQILGFAVHLSLLSHTGSGDAFMSPAFQKRLEGNSYVTQPDVSALPMPEAMVELNLAMARYSRQVLTHPYGSKWYSWPFGWRGIYFWSDHAPERTARIYMLPNLVTWWLALLGMLYMAINLLPRGIAALTGRSHIPVDPIELLLVGTYLVNFLPFAPIERVLFLYHYFPSLIVSLIASARLAGKIDKPYPIAIAVTMAAAIMFVWLMPIVYGMRLDQEGFIARMLLSSWV